MRELLNQLLILVIKPDSSIRIFGDYKQTSNRAFDYDKYLTPRTEDLFDSSSGGEKFAKPDLSHAYQQFVLSPGSPILLAKRLP